MGDNEGKNILQNYTNDQTIICREKFMKEVAKKELVTKTEQAEETSNFDIHDWYPFVNSYYTYTENLDAFARVNHLLSSKVSTGSLSTVSTALPPEPSSFYSERDAQNSYLRSKPISFLILGKPMIGEEELGRLLADYWKCVYIDPEILIKEEIASGSRAGVCIEFNLRCGRAIGVDVIVRLIEKRVKTQTVLHRGFVLCGLPVIPNDLYEEDPVSSESAVFNVLEIFDELLESAFDAMPQPSRPHVSISSIAKSEEGVEDEEEPEGQGAESVAEEQTEADQLEKKIDTPLLDTIPLEIGIPLGPVCSVPTIGTNYEEQLNYIFEFFSDPFMIIYITCNNQDVISKRQDYRFDIYSQSTIDLQKERTNKIIFSLFNRDHGYDVPNIAEEFLDAQRNIGVDSSQLTHLVRLPINFAANVQTELDRFHQMATELIEKRVLEHDQQYFLKVDGRTTATRMFNSVKWRLRILPIHRVLIPELLNVVEPYGGGENEELPKFTTEGLTLDQCFREFSKRQIASRLYKWTWSDWQTKCPVSMFEGKYVDGTPDFAVHFMNKIFFLLDHDTFIKFYRNPRPYLLPPFPTSHAKIFIFGPNFSGKSAVADAFGYMLNATVLNHNEIQNQFIEDRKLELIERVRQAALNEAMMILNEERRLKALEQKKLREGKIKHWLREFKRFVIFENERLKHEKRKGTAVISSFPLLMVVSGEKEDKNRQIFESDIEFHIFLNEYTCAELLQNEAEMKRYLPEELSKSQVEEKIIPATAFDEFVLEKANQAVANFEMGDIVLDDDDLLEMYAIAIKKIEDEYMQREHCLGGWIIDGMPYNVNLVQKLVALYPPDHTIVLEDRSSVFLSERCKTRGENVFVDYKNLFLELDKPEAAARAPAEESMKYKIRLVQDIILDLLDSVSFTDSESKVEIKGMNSVNFEGNLEQIKTVLMDATKFPFIEIDVANKTVKDMVKETIKTFEDRYRQKPFIFTDEDRLQEAEDFRYITEPDEAAGEGYGGIDGDSGFEANRRYGDTYHYCPVTFHDKWVLWKGKEEFIASYQGKVHLFSCEADMEAFVADCLKYLPINKPFLRFPPPRICVIGNSRSGKTSVSKALGRNYGLCYVSFMDYLQNVQISDSENINIQNYLQSDEPLPESVLTTVLSKLWFEDPYQSMGFVLDDFPKRPSDVPVMVHLKAIPDVILQLHADEIILRQRTIEEGLNSWKTEMEAERQRQLYNNQLKTMKWEEQRKERIEHLMEARRQRRYALKKADRESKEEKPVRPYMEDLEETDEETDRSTFRTKSQVSFDSVAEQDDLNEVMKLVGEEIPEPVFEENWESVEDVTERLAAVFDSSYSVNRDYITNIKELCLDAPIPWKSINADINLTSSCNQAFILADEYKFRTESLFERCYDITVEVAERLLASGYYFLSHFGRTCPVQYHIGDIPIQLFIPMEQKLNIYPIIHRQYIYFTVGPSHRDAFRKDPLKYTAIKSVDFPLIPLKLAIIGPPKCGKTALAERFRNEFGMKVITRGQAARYVLSYLSHTVLAKAMEITLRKGLELTDRMTMGSVEASAFDPRVVTQGVVFDGFPNSIKEMKHLAAMGFTPHLICDLYTDDLDMYKVILSEAIKQYDPPYSMRFMEHRFNVWNDTQKHFRSWVDREYQILAKIPIDATMWNVWVKSYELAKAAMYEIKHYHIHAKDDWPLRLSYMQVTPLEFKERRSTYKHFCPCCLHYHNKLTSKGCPPDRTGLVHYRRYFYYLCAGHIDEFLATPQKFIPPYNNHKLPDDLPERVKLKKMPRNVHEDGYCVACLKHSGKSVLGVLEFAVRYKEVIYLFDTLECLEEFMSYPEEFSSLEVMIRGEDIKYPILDYQTLPILGTLEQFVAGQIIKAINSVASHRPLIPGLTVAQSALVGVGLYLKLQNANIPPENSARYKEGLIEYHRRRQILMNYLAIMKKYRNPYLFYQESMPKLKVSTWIKEKFGRILPRPTDGSNTSSTRRVPVPDDRFTHLCDYFKPLSKVPAFLNVVDIAGLVKGASEGQGLGNAFLSHISACDAIFHLCRAFEDDGVIHVEGDVNPIRDLEIILEELRLKDEETLLKSIDKVEKLVGRGNDKKLKPEHDTLLKVKTVLVDEKSHIRFSDWDVKDIEVLNKYLFLTSKPALYLVNLAEKDYIKKKNKWLIKIKEWVDKHDPGALIIPFSGAFESKLVDNYSDPDLRKKFLEESGATSALDKIIVQGYRALQLEYFFTSGPDEVKAWTIQKGSKAPQAAGRIHTDFEKGFIMAEVMKYADFKEEGSEAACKSAGKYRQQGRNYVVEDGDIIFFKFNAGAGLKDPKKK